MAQRLLRLPAEQIFPGSSPGLRFILHRMPEIDKKIDKELFELISSGKKKFEVRIEDDCRFNEGDVLVLKEKDDSGKLTGRQLKKRISFVLRTKECNWWKKEDIDAHGFTVLSLE